MAERKRKTNIKSDEKRLRLSVYRSNNNIFAQIIDDSEGKTVISASSLKIKNGGSVEAAKEVGKLLGSAAKEKKIKNVIFDRGRFVYKGRLKAFADSARESGLEF